jgi:3-isopropylmalate/(R)-2-methylmalate dehydratase small subunit
VGLPAIISSEACDLFESGDEVDLDLSSGTLTRKSDGLQIRFEPLPDFLLRILESGGLVPYMRERLSV